MGAEKTDLAVEHMKIFNFWAFFKNKVVQKGQKSILMGSMVGLDPNTQPKKIRPFSCTHFEQISFYSLGYFKKK